MTTLEGLSAFASSGVMLALPHVTAMQSSLPILKKNYKFSKVFFWGKLQGRKSDYLIAMGVEDSYNTKKFFFCLDGVSWAELPGVTDDVANLVSQASSHGSMLSGDISTAIELPPEDVPTDAEPPETKSVVEIMRLAVMVDSIDKQCAMAPVGALMKKSDHSVVYSPTFSGLSYDQAVSAASYVFTNLPKESSVLSDALTVSSNFLTPCCEVVPTGALSCKFDEVNNCVTWRSLVYPGFLSYAQVGAPFHGYVYFGTGLKNTDIGFMLP